MPQKKIKVYILDDDAYTIDGVILYLKKTCSDIQVVGSDSNLETAADNVVAAAPDVILVDILFGGTYSSDGIQTFERIKKLLPEVKGIAFTNHDQGELVKRAVRAGLNGYLRKSNREGLPEGIRRVYRNDVAIEPDLERFVFAAADPTQKALSPKQVEVLLLLAKGLRNKEIADKLGMAEATVKEHVRHIMRKTGCQNRTELANYARDNKLNLHP